MKKAIIIAVSILLILGGIALIAKRKRALAELKPPKQYPVIISTIKPEMSNFSLTLTALGIVKSDTDVSVSTKIAARVLALKPVGSNVSKGEIIARLDSSSTKSKLASVKSSLRSLYSKLNSAKLTLGNMIKTHKRTKELMAVKGASIEQFQKEEDNISDIKSNIAYIKSNIESEKNLIKELNDLLEYTVIKSPVEGIISKKFLNVGDVAMPGKTIYDIATTGEKYLLMRLPENIKPAGIIFKKRFYKVYPLKGTFNGLNEYKSDVSTDLNTDSRVEIKVVVFKGKAIKLPVDAVLQKNGRSYVLIAGRKFAKPETVKIVSSGEEGVALLNKNIVGKRIIVAKPDILLKLFGGTAIKRAN